MDSKELRGLMEAYSEVYAPQEVEEAVKGESSETRRDMAAERKAGDKRLSPSAGKANADKMERDIKFYDKITKKTKPSVVGMTHEENQIEEVGEEMKPLPKNKMFRKAGNLGRDIVSPATGDEDRQKKYDRQKKIIRTLNKANEEFDVFDVVREFLYVEGFAETLEEAEWMMANLIDEEAVDIILGEAQAARNNPEKYEREQSKKYAPVRGERTPMPPRGDKRREDFEKWYAKQMGR